MTKEQLAERYAARIARCFTALKILIIGAVAAIAALVIFAAVAGGINMKESNPEGVLLGVIIPGLSAVACVTGALCTIVIAKITMTRLKKLGAEQS